MYGNNTKKRESNDLENEEGVFSMLKKTSIKHTKSLLENIDIMSKFDIRGDKKDQSKSEFFNVNREIEGKMKDLFETKINQESVTDSSEISKKIQKIIRFKSLLIDSQIFNNYDFISDDIDRVCKNGNAGRDELISKVQEELKQSSSEDDLRYAGGIMESLRSKTFIKEIQEIEDGNEIVGKLRRNIDFFSSDSNIIKIAADKMIDIIADKHNTQLFLQDDDAKKLLMAVVRSNVKNFDFDNLDFSITNIKPAAFDNLIAGRYSSSVVNLISRIISNSNGQGTDIVILKDSKGIVDAVKINGEDIQNIEDMRYENNRLPKCIENGDDIALKIIEDKKALESNLIKNGQAGDMKTINIYYDTDDELPKDWILHIDSSNNPVIYTICNEKISIEKPYVCLKEIIKEYEELGDLGNLDIPEDIPEGEEPGLEELKIKKQELVIEEGKLRKLFSQMSRNNEKDKDKDNL